MLAHVSQSSYVSAVLNVPYITFLFFPAPNPMSLKLRLTYNGKVILIVIRLSRILYFMIVYI
jgi:hypothetical protein